MAKKTRVREAVPAGENPRRPCPCGSGKRYKACHGAGDDVIVIRPFEGLAAECDLVALREFLPSAKAPLSRPSAGGSTSGPLPLKDARDRVVTLASVLPGASAALVRPDGEILVGMQVQTRSGDLSADLARALTWAFAAEPGTSLPVVPPSAEGGERLQDLLVADAALDVTLFADFAWWVPPNEDGSEPTAEVTATLERANAVIMPTEPVVAPGVRAAYWVDTGTKAHLRWVRPEPEDALLAALARLQARGELGLGENTRYAGSFRAHGLLVPVWDLDRDLHPKEWTEPVGAFATKLEAALAETTPLTDAQRRAKDALAGKQITLR